MTYLKPLVAVGQPDPATLIRDLLAGAELSAVAYSVFERSEGRGWRGKRAGGLHADIQCVGLTFLGRPTVFLTWAIAYTGPLRGVEGLAVVDSFEGACAGPYVEVNHTAWESLLGTPIANVDIGWIGSRTASPEAVWGCRLKAGRGTALICLGGVEEDEPSFEADELLVIFDDEIAARYVTANEIRWERII